MLWSPNTQLHYPFQNTAKDYSGNARDGTIYGSGVFATKPNGGRCLYFDGTGDYVASPSFALSGTVVIFACDIRCKEQTTPQQILVEPKSNTVGFIYHNRIRNSANLYTAYATGSAIGDHSVVNFFSGIYDDAWLHMIVVWDFTGAYAYAYRNAVLFASWALTTPVFPSTNQVMYIGQLSSANYLIDGYLANVYIGTLPSMPAAAQMLANANRLMLGINPIW